jgi:hypothetical protein
MKLNIKLNLKLNIKLIFKHHMLLFQFQLFLFLMKMILVIQNSLKLLIIILDAKHGIMIFVFNVQPIIISIKMVSVAKLLHHVKLSIELLESVKIAIKDMDFKMENVSEQTLLTRMEPDVKHGIMKNVLNVQLNGSLILNQFVKKLVIYVELGVQLVDNVKLVIMVMF